MDKLYPPFAPGWEACKRAFPGRTLIVSNSAGSAKDRGGIGAESLSMSLQAPVLAHQRPKPACAADIIDFFRGRLPLRTGRALSPAIHTAAQEEDAAERFLLDKWRGHVERGPLCGELQRPQKGTDDLEAKMVAAQHADKERYDAEPQQPEKAEDEAATARGKDARRSAHDNETDKAAQRAEREKAHRFPATAEEEEPLRVVVVGDRKFTDVLLARRLALYPDVVSLSIQTTDLPQPHDVRILRRIEDRLAGPKEDPAGAPWEAYIRHDPPPPPPPTLKERLSPSYLLAEPGPPVIWYDPRTWRWKPILAATLTGLGKAVSWISVEGARGIKAASIWSVAKIKEAWHHHKIRSAERKKEAAAKAHDEKIAQIAEEKGRQEELRALLQPKSEIKGEVTEPVKQTTREQGAPQSS